MRLAGIGCSILRTVSVQSYEENTGNEPILKRNLFIHLKLHQMVVTGMPTAVRGLPRVELLRGSNLMLGCDRTGNYFRAARPVDL